MNKINTLPKKSQKRTKQILVNEMKNALESLCSSAEQMEDRINDLGDENFEINQNKKEQRKHACSMGLETESKYQY